MNRFPRETNAVLEAGNHSFSIISLSRSMGRELISAPLSSMRIEHVLSQVQEYVDFTIVAPPGNFLHRDARLIEEVHGRLVVQRITILLKDRIFDASAGLMHLRIRAAAYSDHFNPIPAESTLPSSSAVSEHITKREEEPVIKKDLCNFLKDEIDEFNDILEDDIGNVDVILKKLKGVVNEG